MLAQDPFTQHYQQELVGSYDVVDRIVLNGYYRLAGSGGGFRCWWERLYGSAQDLNDTALTRMASAFARRIQGWCKKHNIPYVKASSGERSHQLAAQHVPTDPGFTGIFAVVAKRAPAVVWEVLQFEKGGFHLRRKKNKVWVNHYAFQIMDADWGHIVIRVCGAPPFKAMIILNGHEYVARRAQRAGVVFTKEGNCFTRISHPERLAQMADRLKSPDAMTELRAVAERWVYRCVCFALTFEEQRRSDFRYDYSMLQLEFSRNLLFRRGHEMDQIFAAAIERTRSALNATTVLTIFGAKQRPRAHTKKNPGTLTRFEKVIERPVYDMTVFKLNFKHLATKMYTKGANVLRIEAVAHAAQDLRTGRVLERFGAAVESLQQILERFMAAVHGVDAAWITNDELEVLPAPSTVGKTRVGGIDVNKPRIRAVMQAAVELAASPHGFTAAVFAERMNAILGPGWTYAARHAAYDLKKLRGKGLVQKMGPRGRSYETTPDGIRMIAGLYVLRERILKPLLTYRGRLKSGNKMPGKLPQLYEALQRQMQHLFAELNLVA